jgi:amino acid transporter
VNATVAVAVIAAAILGVFSANTDALFILFSAATLLPALIYAGTVALYLIKRNHLPASRGFTLGRWEIPVLVIAVIWLIFELAIFRDAIFRDPWLYVLAMVAIGAIYLGYLLVTRRVRGLAMPDMSSIDAELARVADTP